MSNERYQMYFNIQVQSMTNCISKAKCRHTINHMRFEFELGDTCVKKINRKKQSKACVLTIFQKVFVLGNQKGQFRF